jgi:minor extracellular serine protease Vpr
MVTADLRDQLDIVNLSLGSGYGNPKILYAEAVKNLVQGGTVAVISAGNSGNVDYIVGAPGTSTEALSVAASIDNGDHNWKYDASEIVFAN